jgi:hypothetical protein
VRDPLKGWTRKDATLTDPFSIQDPLVACTGLRREFLQIGQPGIATQIPWALTTVSMRIARPSFRYCLIRECL